jgi:hypothetical protein
MSDLFGNTVEIPGRISPGEFMLKSEQIGLGYGQLFNSAFQSSMTQARQSASSAPPPPREDGEDPNNTEKDRANHETQNFFSRMFKFGR